MKLKTGQIFGPLVAVALFCLALRVLYTELHNYRYEDIVIQFGHLPWQRVAIAGLFTFLSYLVLTFYDVLAIKYVGFPLPYRRVATASFVGYTLSHNLGFPLFTGGAARFRLFSSWGMSPPQIAQAIAFSGILFWVGFAALAGVTFLYDPPIVPEGFGIPPQSLRLIGVLCLLLVAAYFVFFVFRKHPFRVKEWEFPPPPLGLSVVGMVVAAIDWWFAAAVAMAILPDTGMSHAQFLGLFELGQFAGLISHIPGGIGVFEATVLAFLDGRVSGDRVIGALVAYRIVYYLVPLACSCTLLLVNEVISQRDRVRKIAGGVIRKISPVLPSAISLALFSCGIVLLFSGATPPIEPRYQRLLNFLPVDIVESSHFLASVAGMGLIILARGILRKLDSAYVLSVLLLSIGIITSLLKGLNYEEAIILSIMLAVLFVSRRHFFRRASLFAEAFEPGWIAAVVSALIATVWLVLFAYKHIEYGSEVWWQFGSNAYASRSLRATIGAMIVCGLWALAKLFTPAASDDRPASEEEFEKIKNIVSHASRSYAALALLGDKNFLFSRSQQSFIMFGIQGKSCVALGDPVGPKEEYSELIWEFREMCDRHGSDCVFYQVHQDHMPLYLDAGLSLLKLGEEGLVPLDGFSLSGRAMAALKSNKNKFEREGYTTEVLSREQTAQILPVLLEISGDWPLDNGKGAVIGSLDPGYIQQFPAAVVRRENEIVAFANVWCGEKEEFSADVVRYRRGVLSGIMDFLLVDLMLWARDQGYMYFTLGLAPLSGSGRKELAPLWNKVGNMVFRHGEHFHNLDTVLSYKEKFRPIWQPRYLASPGGLRLPKILANVATLISDEFKGVVIK